MHAHYYLPSIYLLQDTVMHKQSHTLCKIFSKAELTVDVHHPLADDISSDINSPDIFEAKL